jgi:hypothetical protein
MTASVSQPIQRKRRHVTKRAGRQKTLIADRALFDLLAAAVDLMAHAGADYSEAKLIRNAIRERAADIAERVTDDALAALGGVPASEARRIRSEVEARRKILREAARAAGERED